MIRRLLRALVRVLTVSARVSCDPRSHNERRRAMLDAIFDDDDPIWNAERLSLVEESVTGQARSRPPRSE